MEFYREIFPLGELQRSDESGNWKCHAIAVELIEKDGACSTRRYSIGDDLSKLEELLEHENFILMSPIGYVGKSRESKNARFLYALAIDLDGVDEMYNMSDLFFQMDGRGESDFIPEPTYIVSSGNGLHLYYVFKQPIPCFKNIIEQLSALKHRLTQKIWNGYVTNLSKKVQFQSVFQGFRIVGGVTKNGGRVKAYEVGKKVTIDYLNEFVSSEYQVTEFAYKSNLTKAEAKKKYPEWYERRIEQGMPRGSWVCNRALYDWWIRRVKDEIVEGHRYYGVMCLAVYAKKCNIPFEELSADAFGLIGLLDSKTEREGNHFTKEDVLSALEMYNDDYITFPIDTISELTNLRIDKNKRNGRKRSEHVKLMNGMKQLMRQFGEVVNDGRPSKADTVYVWRKLNPNGKKAQCVRDTGLTKPTVYKWWDYSPNAPIDWRNPVFSALLTVGDDIDVSHRMGRAGRLSKNRQSNTDEQPENT